MSLLLLLAACSSGDSPQAECERQADQDPAVRAIYTRTNGDYTSNLYQSYYDLGEAKRLATLRCLRAKLGCGSPVPPSFEASDWT